MAYVGKAPANAALTSSDINNGIITADKLASNSVTEVKVNADAITNAKTEFTPGLTIKGDGSSADGKSSGGHWNPTAQPHGKWGAETGYHKGDIGNFIVENSKDENTEFLSDVINQSDEKSTGEVIEKIIEDFKFETPKKLPKICSLISGYFSYDSIRYIEKIPNNCKNDLNLPDVRLLRPRTLVIHDNLKKEIFYIVNIFNDEKIINYEKKFDDIKSELFKLTVQSTLKKLIKSKSNVVKNIKVKSNTPKNKFLNMVNKAKKYIKLGDIFQVVLSQRFEAKLTKNPLEIYKKLRVTNPSPFMFFFNFNGGDSFYISSRRFC